MKRILHLRAHYWFSTSIIARATIARGAKRHRHTSRELLFPMRLLFRSRIVRRDWSKRASSGLLATCCRGRRGDIGLTGKMRELAYRILSKMSPLLSPRTRRCRVAVDAELVSREVTMIFPSMISPSLRAHGRVARGRASVPAAPPQLPITHAPLVTA